MEEEAAGGGPQRRLGLEAGADEVLLHGHLQAFDGALHLVRWNRNPVSFFLTLKNPLEPHVRAQIPIFLEIPSDIPLTCMLFL